MEENQKRESILIKVFIFIIVIVFIAVVAYIVTKNNYIESPTNEKALSNNSNGMVRLCTQISLVSGGKSFKLKIILRI